MSGRGRALAGALATGTPASAPGSSAARLHRLLDRVVPCDVTLILLLDVTRLRDAPAPRADLPAGPAPSLVVLDLATVRTRATAGRSGFAAALPNVGDDDTPWCAAALFGDALVAHAWFVRERVAPSLNSGGVRFAGIGLRLPATIAYAFKVHVAPPWRGRGLATALIAHGTRHAPDGALRGVVTTTAAANVAYRRSALTLGFERRDWALECVIGRRHRYRLPRPLAVPGERRVEFFPGDPRSAGDGGAGR